MSSDFRYPNPAPVWQSEEMRNLPYIVMDVFTATPLEGNPLAVFFDGRDLETRQMQRLARETNLSETTFIIPRDPQAEAKEGVKVRIFTISEELPFAGHPTIGTAAVIRGSRPIPEVVLNLPAGKVPVRFEDRLTGPAFAEMQQLDPEFGNIHRPEDVAPIAGLRTEDMSPDLPIQTVSTGLRFCIVPVKTLAALKAVRFDSARADAYAGRSDLKFFYFVTPDTGDPATRLRARMMFYGNEDPATGSAAGCAAAWMVRYGVSGSAERVRIEQGAECGRPSQIFVSARHEHEKVTAVRCGGHAVAVARGEFTLP